MTEIDSLLANPAAQSALIPLVSAFIVAWILGRAGALWSGLAILAGFILVVALTTGVGFQPLTSDRKIVLATLVLPIIGFFLDWKCPQRWLRAVVLALLLGMAAIWVIWPVLMRQEGMDMLAMLARVAVYAAWIGGSLIWFGNDRFHQQGAAIIALGIGTGAAAVLAATALYGQWSFGVAAATGGLFLYVLLRKSAPHFGTYGMMVAAVPLALLGAAATVYAKMPLASLLCLIFITVFAAIPVCRQANDWVRSTVATLLALIPAIPAIWIAWKVAGPVPL